MQRLGRAGGWWLLFLFFNCSFSMAQENAVKINSSAPDSSKTHVQQHLVQPGDTYFQLARKYQVPVDSLIKWNGENLPVGKMIRLQAYSSVAPNNPAAEPETVHNLPISANEQKQSGTTLKQTKERTEIESSAHKSYPRIIIIPFDPYLYFSDADDDIARQSEIAKQKIRYIFRSRLTSFLDPKGFETINLLEATSPDSSDELRGIYKSLSYKYQKITLSKFNLLPKKTKTQATGPKAWFQKQKEKAGLASPTEEGVAQEGGNYYGVQVKDAAFFNHLNAKYNLDYYLFINQFEIHTDYTNCIDRTTQNFQREFLVHYTIFDASGKLIAGNKVKIPYESNVNDINKIVRDNLGKMAQVILSDLPQSPIFSSEAAQK